MEQPSKIRSTRIAKPASPIRASRTESVYDVIVVGGGPAGSTLAWKLASNGVSTIVLDGAKFPREKVCGDYVEPRGLRILNHMGGLNTLDAISPLPITHSSTYIDGDRAYFGKIPFYGVHEGLAPHGYIVPRDVFDSLLIEIAGKAGATIHQETYVNGFTAAKSGVEVQAQSKGKNITYRARAVVGADGVNSVIARCAGLLANDPRHTALSQRAYADGLDGGMGEAAFFFEADFFPGYGWMFPMQQGRVNLGVGILKETCQRDGISVPHLFREFFDKLKRYHPHCKNLKLCKPPIGGIVKTYGSAGPNYFDSGLLIGDAGCFVDPMTGEGITPAMESALIAAHVILDGLQKGPLNLGTLSAYEERYRSYFDPSMIFVDLCAATLRNRHYWGSWKKALVRGCAIAQTDKKFAATVGGCFGGMEVNPVGILAEVWKKTAESFLALGTRTAFELMVGNTGAATSAIHEYVGWMADSWKSLSDDPFWHARWTMELNGKWIHALSEISNGRTDPRIKGVS